MITEEDGSGACRFCLSVVKQPYPDRCPHCHVVMCSNCGTFIKGDNPSFCYGCGKIKPELQVNFTRISSFRMLYMEDGWQERNKGVKNNYTYQIHTGYVYKLPDGKVDMTKIGSCLVKRFNAETYEDVRILTDEEVKLLQNEDNNNDGYD